MTTVTVRIPFAGFYESSWDHAIDREVDDLVEYLADEEYPDVPRGELAEFVWRAADFGATHERIAREYAERFADWLATELDLPGGSFTYDGMSSPKFYNFETDRLFLRVPLEVAHELMDRVDLPTLRRVVTARHSSRDGFISFYSNDLDTWLERPLSEWDHNELETLLLAWMEDEGFDPRAIEDDIEMEMHEGSEFMQALSVDMDEVREAVEDYREEQADIDADEVQL